MTRQREAAHRSVPLYRRVLGDHWDHLPPRVRKMHDNVNTLTAEGVATVERGTSFAAHVLSALFRFPKTGVGVPVRVAFSVHDGIETWTRTFAGRRMVSRQMAGQGRNAQLIVERFGPFAFGLSPVVRDGRLFLIGRSWSLLGMPLPSALVPNGVASEHEEDGRFHFDVAIAAPLIGTIVLYRGWLVPCGRAT